MFKSNLAVLKVFQIIDLAHGIIVYKVSINALLVK